MPNLAYGPHENNENYPVDEAFICLEKLIIHRVVMRRKRSERICHVVGTKKNDEQAIGSGPRDFAVIDVGVQKLFFNLVFEALHSRSKARHDNRVVYRGSTVA